MATITVPRADVTPEEVSRALCAGLGPRYGMLPGMQASYAFGTLRLDQPDAIVVGTTWAGFLRSQADVLLTR